MQKYHTYALYSTLLNNDKTALVTLEYAKLYLDSAFLETDYNIFLPPNPPET